MTVRYKFYDDYGGDDDDDDDDDVTYVKWPQNNSCDHHQRKETEIHCRT